MICHEGVASYGRIPVTDNVYDIPVRLKALNRDFFVMFNTLRQKYEIHCASQIGDTLACTLPYDELDARAITHARKYAAARLEEIAREVDAYNEKLLADAERNMLDKANYKMRETFNYLKNNTHTDSVPKEVIEE